MHLRMGYSAVLAGSGHQHPVHCHAASRPWAGRISDHMGAKVSVLWGMACCTASGAFLVGAAALHDVHWLSFAVLIVSRLVLGVGESLGSTGATLWGITSAGQEHTAKVIGLNGISTYGGMALAAPLGVVLDQQWGLASIGVLTILIGAVSFAMAWRKDPVPVEPGEHLPFAPCAGPRGPARHGAGAGRRQLQRSGHLRHAVLRQPALERRGALPHGLRVGVHRRARAVSSAPSATSADSRWPSPRLLTEAVGMVLLWQAVAPWMALAGAAVGGLGFSLVFPAIGVEAVKRVPEFNRGTALGVYTAFSDVSFFLVGPIAGAIIGFFGYASASSSRSSACWRRWALWSCWRRADRSRPPKGGANAASCLHLRPLCRATASSDRYDGPSGGKRACAWPLFQRRCAAGQIRRVFCHEFIRVRNSAATVFVKGAGAALVAGPASLGLPAPQRQRAQPQRQRPRRHA